SPPRRTGTGSSGLHREESRCTLENVPLVPEHPILPPQPPQLFALLSRQTLARSRVDGRLFNPAADRRLAEVHLPTNRRDRPVTPLHQGNDLRLERGRERSPWSATRPLLLHLLPHSNTLLVGLRPHLGCSPVGGKATWAELPCGALVATDRDAQRATEGRREIEDPVRTRYPWPRRVSLRAARRRRRIGKAADELEGGATVERLVAPQMARSDVDGVGAVVNHVWVADRARASGGRRRSPNLLSPPSGAPDGGVGLQAVAIVVAPRDTGAAQTWQGGRKPDAGGVRVDAHPRRHQAPRGGPAGVQRGPAHAPVIGPHHELGALEHVGGRCGAVLKQRRVEHSSGPRDADGGRLARLPNDREAGNRSMGRLPRKALSAEPMSHGGPRWIAARPVPRTLVPHTRRGSRHPQR